MTRIYTKRRVYNRRLYQAGFAWILPHFVSAFTLVAVRKD
jgi:hypothetical protein